LLAPRVAACLVADIAQYAGIEMVADPTVEIYQGDGPGFLPDDIVRK